MMILLFYLDAAYPREGTVTATPYSACSTIVMQLIPARGRLLSHFATLRSVMVVDAA